MGYPALANIKPLYKYTPTNQGTYDSHGLKIIPAETEPTSKNENHMRKEFITREYYQVPGTVDLHAPEPKITEPFQLVYSFI